MSFWDDLQDKAKQVVKKAGETIGDVKEQTTTEWQVLMLRRQISLCESEIKELQNGIGKKVYDMRSIQPETFANPDVVALCEKITEQLGKIADLEKEILKTREEGAARGSQPGDPGDPGNPGEPGPTSP